jgi:putative toxin-antitoxin system antitoxin component (TIGR02293 family)
MALFSAIDKGFHFDVFLKMADLILIDKIELARILSITPTTLYRRSKVGRLKSDESDKLYRLISAYSAALSLFENERNSTASWFLSGTKGLGGKRPIDMVLTSAGYDTLIDFIGRLEHGVFA